MAAAINADDGVVSGSAGLKSSADATGVLALQTNGTTAISISAAQVVSFTNQPTYTGGTANGVMFLNGSKVVTTGTALTFDGAILGVNGISVGRGAGAVATNTAVGNSALAANTTGGTYNSAGGYQALYVNQAGSTNTAFGAVSLTANTSGSDNSAFGVAALGANISGTQNTALGRGALELNTTASNNTAVGYQAGYSTVGNGTGITAFGYQAAYTHTATSPNYADTFIGYRAGYLTTTGADLTFIGGFAGNSNTTGSYNTAIGGGSLYANTTASANTAVGYATLTANTTGADNIAMGVSALASNTTGGSNTALGRSALAANTTASGNTAVGYQALITNITGNQNNAFGYRALYSATGGGNLGIGNSAGYGITTGAGNICIGGGVQGVIGSAGQDLTTGSYNVILGNYTANTAPISNTGSNNIVLADGQGNVRGIFDPAGNFIVTGNGSTTSQAGTATIYSNEANKNVLNVNSLNTAGSQYILNLQSNASIANTAFLIRGYSDTSTGVFFVAGSGNVTNANNSYGAISDVKLKENIVDASPKLAGLMQVKVRNYNLIGNTTKQLGVVAQELETVFPAMVEETKDVDKDLNDLGTVTKTVKYSVFIPMLIKAMQEQQAIIESLKARLDAANL